MRFVVIGNSGSGKSSLAKRVGAELLLPVHDLDHTHWYADGRKREETQSKALVSGIAAGSAWVIEGVYGWLAEIALERATALVWLDLPWAECQNGLLCRGLRRGMTQRDQDALLSWASAYWTRTTPSSFVGHERLYAGFTGRKWRLQARSDLSAFALALDR